jgi:hypothetical protein
MFSPMGDLFFGAAAPWFSVPAFAGTFFFVARMALTLVGGDHDAGLDADHGDVGHDHSSGAFKFLSIQAISAFAMGFGWGGLGAYRGTALPALLAVPVGLGVGLGMMWLLARLLTWIARMQVSGTIAVGAALDEEGVVYVTVPAARAGRGTVRVVVNDRMRYYPAVTDGDVLATATAVRVVAVNEDNTLTVVPIRAGLLSEG